MSCVCMRSPEVGPLLLLAPLPWNHSLSSSASESRERPRESRQLVNAFVGNKGRIHREARLTTPLSPGISVS